MGVDGTRARSEAKRLRNLRRGREGGLLGVVGGREGQRAGPDVRGEGGEAFGDTAQMGPDQRHQHRAQQTMLGGDRPAQRFHDPGETLGGRRKRRRR